MDTVIRALALIGFISVCGVILLFLIYLFVEARKLINELIYRYQYKHRFDKPPIAKCYCRDCSKWDPIDGECSDHCNSRHMADKWFCCFADPLTKDEAEKRRKQYELLN